METARALISIVPRRRIRSRPGGVRAYIYARTRRDPERLPPAASNGSVGR